MHSNLRVCTLCEGCLEGYQRSSAHGIASKQQIPFGNDRKKSKSIGYSIMFLL